MWCSLTRSWNVWIDNAATVADAVVAAAVVAAATVAASAVNTSNGT